MMKNNLTLVSLLVLAACASVEAKPVASENGAESYNLSCHDLYGTRDPCMAEADKLCKEGFSVVEKHSYKVEHADSGDGFYMPPKYFVTVLCNPT